MTTVRRMRCPLSLKKCLAGHEVSVYSGADSLLADIEKKKIQQGYLLIRIKNKCRGNLSVEKNTVPKSSKKEPGHGFGPATIQEAAAALDGDMFAYTDSGNFVLDVMVRMKRIFEAG